MSYIENSKNLKIFKEITTYILEDKFNRALIEKGIEELNPTTDPLTLAWAVAMWDSVCEFTISSNLIEKKLKEMREELNGKNDNSNKNRFIGIALGVCIATWREEVVRSTLPEEECSDTDLILYLYKKVLPTNSLWKNYYKDHIMILTETLNYLNGTEGKYLNDVNEFKIISGFERYSMNKKHKELRVLISIINNNIIIFKNHKSSPLFGRMLIPAFSLNIIDKDIFNHETLISIYNIEECHWEYLINRLGRNRERDILEIVKAIEEDKNAEKYIHLLNKDIIKEKIGKSNLSYLALNKIRGIMYNYYANSEYF